VVSKHAIHCERVFATATNPVPVRLGNYPVPPRRMICSIFLTALVAHGMYLISICRIQPPTHPHPPTHTHIMHTEVGLGWRLAAQISRRRIQSLDQIGLSPVCLRRCGCYGGCLNGSDHYKLHHHHQDHHLLPHGHTPRGSGAVAAHVDASRRRPRSTRPVAAAAAE
jgi:hypothetical protein